MQTRAVFNAFNSFRWQVGDIKSRSKPCDALRSGIPRRLAVFRCAKSFGGPSQETKNHQESRKERICRFSKRTSRKARKTEIPPPEEDVIRILNLEDSSREAKRGQIWISVRPWYPLTRQLHPPSPHSKNDANILKNRVEDSDEEDLEDALESEQQFQCKFDLTQRLQQLPRTVCCFERRSKPRGDQEKQGF